MVARPPRPTGEPHLFRTTRPRRGRDGPGPCSWTQRPDGSGPRFHKSEGHTQQRGSSSSNSSGSREALTPPETQGSAVPHSGPQSARPRPLRARLGGGRRVKGDGRLRLLRLPTAASAGWTRPARRSPRRSGHLRTLASGPPAPRQIFAPSQAIAIWAPAPGRGQRPRPRLRQAGPPRGQAAQAQRTRPSTRPGRKDFNQERALSESGKLPIDREEGSPQQAPQGAGQAPAGGGRVINGPVT